MNFHFENKKSFNIVRIISWFFLGMVTAVIFAFVFGYFVQQLWNWLMPRIFHLTTITFWEAFGMVLLARLFLGGHHHESRYHHQKHYHPDCTWNDSERETWKIKGGHHNWKYYDEWWKTEGKEKFEAFIDQKQPSEKEK